MTTNDEIIDKEDERLGREKQEDNLFSYQSVNRMLDEAKADTSKSKCPVCNEGFDTHLCQAEVVDKAIKELRQQVKETKEMLLEIETKAKSDTAKQIFKKIEDMTLNASGKCNNPMCIYGDEAEEQYWALKKEYNIEE